ncbi:Coiled-coil domain-containing protein 11 [Tetrabaena socialis]|uniref:Cilia- and flagella-associated protein 53 n=1 Tax=Tetrabaena socialis TaxID=47790 RepID=A0A2J8AIP0_9CHLO|nr:Coiled-coil domain-containing protein 11 [Tetrabaena socialis]|eukprot:PNH12384.1 Coiled-coil domain-containing protein 11 [Tetrabaena socialis]
MRELEDRLANLKADRKTEGKMVAVAEFEHRTTKKIVNTVVQQRFDALKARQEGDLNARRQRLADKLDAEDLALRHELLASKKTPEQRRAELAARARALAAQREAERHQLATTLYEKAFVQSCDVLRVENSKRILYRTVEERNAQIEQKMVSRIMEEEEKRMWHQMSEDERLKKEQRYLDDTRRARERREETLRILDEQVHMIHARREEAAKLKRAEIAELNVTWQRMAAEAEAAEVAEREKMKKLTAELHEYNRIKLLKISEAERAERELDLHILQEALAKEAADEAAESAFRARRREEMRRYRAQLALMMEKEREESAERDVLVFKAQLEQEAKRDAEIAARDEARRQLMAQVDAIRQLQVQERLAQRLAEAEEKAFDRLRVEEDIAGAAADVAQREAMARKAGVTRRLELQSQMVAKAHMKAAEEDEKLREGEHVQRAEQAFLAKVTQTINNTETPVWHGRKKIEWS